MAEMIVTTPDTKHIVDDYDILFSMGVVRLVTINTELGDYLRVEPDCFVFHLASQPSATDPTKILPEEDVTVYKRYVASMQHRQREIKELTPEQKFEWAKVLQEMSSTVN